MTVTSILWSLALCIVITRPRTALYVMTSTPWQKRCRYSCSNYPGRYLTASPLCRPKYGRQELHYALASCSHTFGQLRPSGACEQGCCAFYRCDYAPDLLCRRTTTSSVRVCYRSGRDAVCYVPKQCKVEALHREGCYWTGPAIF